MTIFRGRWSWIVTIAACLISGGILSPVSCYGWLFTSIQTDVNATAVQSGWIGSVALSSNFLFGPLAVVVERFIGFRQTAILGSSMTALSILLTSYMASYGGVLLFFGFLHGLFASLTTHSILCVLFKYHKSKAAGFVFTSVSVANIFLTLMYEKIIPLVGWRRSVQITAAFVFVLAVPNSFLIYYKDETVKEQVITKQAVDRELKQDKKSDTNKHSEKVMISTVSKNVETMQQKEKESNKGDCSKKWVHLFTSLNAWVILIAIFLPGMAWTTYWVNTVSYYTSLSLTEDSIFIYGTSIAVTEVLGRVLLVIFTDRLPLTETNLLIFINLLFVGVTLVFVCWPTNFALLTCSLLIGTGRGWSAILPYTAAADLLDGHRADQATTLTMVALGVGFLLGSLVAGTIYDATQSYEFAFIINALLFLIGATLLVLLQVRRQYKELKKRRKREKDLEDYEKSLENYSKWNQGFEIEKG